MCFGVVKLRCFVQYMNLAAGAGSSQKVVHHASFNIVYRYMNQPVLLLCLGDIKLVLDISR